MHLMNIPIKFDRMDNLFDIEHMNYDNRCDMFQIYKLVYKTNPCKLDYTIDQYNRNIYTYLVVFEQNLLTIIKSKNTFSAILDDYILEFKNDYFIY